MALRAAKQPSLLKMPGIVPAAHPRHFVLRCGWCDSIVVTIGSKSRDVKLKTVPFIACLALCVAAMGAAQAQAYFNPGKDFDELTAAEKTAAKQAALHQQMRPLAACVDPGNMPFSDKQGQGIDDRIAKVLADAMHTSVSFYWMSYLGQNMVKRAFGTAAEPLGHCDLLIGIPVGFPGVLMTDPIYRSTYVFAYRKDSGIHIKGLDDPALRKLRIGVYETSALRQALAQHGLKNGLDILSISPSTDVDPESQQWWQVERMVQGKLDVVGVWGPFAGYVKTKKHAPIVLQPANLMANDVQLQFSMGIGVRPTDAMLKYALDDALAASRDKIEAILDDFGVPLVKCSECVVGGDLPSHGSYSSTSAGLSLYGRFTQPLDTDLTHIDMSQVAPGEVVTLKNVEMELKAGGDASALLAQAVTASDPVRIKFLAAHGADLDKRDSMGSTPLISAASARDSATVELLLKLGADVNERNGDGLTPLMEAAYRDHVPSIDALVQHGADLKMTNPDGLTALCIALNTRGFRAAQALVEAGASTTAHCGANRLTPLMITATHLKETGHLAGGMVDHGQYPSDGVSPLTIGKLLLDRGADPNARSRGGVTALMIAAGYDNAPIIGLLVQAGAKVDVRADDGKTALDIARDNGNEAAIQTLKLMTRFAPPQGSSRDGAEPPR
jgi:quinoprotein dehydrogenase-associated probable ABC transporter substrate-binding protein